MKAHPLSRLVVALSLLSFHAPGQPLGYAEAAGRIDRYLAAMDSIGFSGTVLVEIDGHEVVSKGYGFGDAGRHVRNAPATVFDIGSITKQFTAAAILKLEMQGRLSTGDTISRFFGTLPNDKKDITIHDLLRHQSGLVSTVGGDYDPIGEAAFLDTVFSSTLLFPTGTAFSYSNIGYSLLAMIIERVSHQDYETYLYENLWKPARMETTGYSRPAFARDSIAVGYSGDGRAWGRPTDKAWDHGAPYWHLKGNGGILSTAGDLLLWNHCLMTDAVLSDEARRKMYHPALREDETGDAIYAYGWDVSRTVRKTTRIWHNGSNRIFYADFMRFPEEHVTLILLSNKSHPDFNDMNFEMARIVFNPAYRPWIPPADNTENRDFTRRILDILEASGLEKAKTAYAGRKASEELLEFVMRHAGFDHLDEGKPEAALAVFEMNAFAHPSSAAAWQALGEGYMETGRNEPALNCFRQSRDINPDNRFVQNMIVKLGQ